MAQQSIFTVYDQKAQAYLPPFMLLNEALAVRAFISAAITEDHNFNKYAEDFVLFELGTWQDDNAKYTLHAAPRVIMNALQARAAGEAHAAHRSPQPAEPARGTQDGTDKLNNTKESN